MAVDDEDIPREFIADDQTPAGSVASDGKVLPPNVPASLPPPAAPAAPPAMGMKMNDGLGPLPAYDPDTERMIRTNTAALLLDYYQYANKADEPDPMPRPLRRLMKQIRRAVEAVTDNLEAGEITPDQWQATMTDTLTNAYPRAYKAGAGADPDDRAQALLDKQVAAQLKYLGNFAVEIKDGAEWQAGWNSRAEMYADSIIVPYWTGATKMLPLPAMPGEGTTCLTRCRCAWDVQSLDGEGDYDAYWRRGASESCQTCRQRAAEWAPLKIRGGRLV
jgi:hypothetical protein